jgi:nucleotide-binding universal stress UspA family protein
MMAPESALPFRTIFHPTDFSADSHTALRHALKLALVSQAELSIMHIDPDIARSSFEDFPRIRPILEQWQLLPPGSTKGQVAQLGVTIRKTRAAATNPTQGILDYLSTHPADLLVLSTHQHEGLARWQHPTVAEPVARGSRTATLFVPTHVEGFVMPDTGRPQLRRVLVPVSEKPHPQVAVDMTTRLAQALGCENLTGVLVHVGDDSAFHAVEYPSRAGWLWHTQTCQGNVVEVILGMGADFDVDLIVMTTEGHDSLLDVMRGSTMERVLRGARCPLLALPV